SVFDVTTGVQQASYVENSYTFAPAKPGGCALTHTVSGGSIATAAWQVTATPLSLTASVVNPYALYVRPHLTPQPLDAHNALQWPGAGSVAADGKSAVV